MAGNLKVAKNAIWLYARTIVNIVLGFFTVRIMLEALGVEDYGLQAVAGSALVVFTFVIQALWASTSRFITFGLGTGDKEKLCQTFGTSLTIHTAAAILLIVVGETVGLWMFVTQLDIPAGRETAAMFCYQFAVLGSALGFIQTPYAACLIAHEVFNVHIWLNIAGSITRIGLLLLICHTSGDHLIYYTIGMGIINIVSVLILFFYCRKWFYESRTGFRLSHELLRPMLNFSSWEIFGALGSNLKSSGMQLIVNMAYGVVVNAAIGIGLTVSGAVTGLAFTLSSAFMPGITKRYAAGDIAGMRENIFNATLLCMLLYGVVGIPLMVELGYVMKLWLGEIPEYSFGICMVQLAIDTLVMAYIMPIESIKAMGANKWINIVLATEGIIAVALTAIAAMLHLSPILICAIFRGGIAINIFFIAYLLSRYISRDFTRHLFSGAVLKVLITEIIVFGILYSITMMMQQGFLRLVTISFSSVILFGAASPTLLPPALRQSLLNLLRTRLPILAKFQI